MSHLGLVTATSFAAKGFKTIGYDPDDKLIAEITDGQLPVDEPNLNERIARNHTLQSFSSDIRALSSCDVIFIAKDVPTDENGVSDLSCISALCGSISEVINLSASLVILCQVPPGFTRSLPFDKSRLFYQVETLVFGRALDRAMYPERFIIGMDAPNKPLPEAYKSLLDSFSCPLLPMKYESAELAKISINMCLVASISTANTLAEICESMGADWSEIKPALHLDKRIGEHAYLKPGLGIAGGNLERDLTTIVQLGDKHGTDVDIVRAWLCNSHHRKQWAYHVLNQHVLSKNPSPVVAVWGLSYKEDTHSTKNSPSLALLNKIRDLYIKVHDPVVSPEIVPFAKSSRSPISALLGADVLLIMTPWKLYCDIDIHEINRALAGKIIIDPYKVLNVNQLDTSISYITLGRKPYLVHAKEIQYA